MGLLFSSCASSTEVKVLPARGGQSDVSDVLNTTFYPPSAPRAPALQRCRHPRADEPVG
jgi:hypothetical protein